MSGSVIDRTLELQLASFIATIYVTIGDYASADRRSERAKALANDLTDTRAVAALYESLAVTRQEQGDYDAALDFARRALGAYEQLELEAMVGSRWNTIGWICIQRRQFGPAEEALVKAEGSAMHRGDQASSGMSSRPGPSSSWRRGGPPTRSGWPMRAPPWTVRPSGARRSVFSSGHRRSPRHPPRWKKSTVRSPTRSRPWSPTAGGSSLVHTSCGSTRSTLAGNSRRRQQRQRWRSA